MKKIILWAIPIILIIVSVVFSLYFYKITQPHRNLLEDKNYEIQIAYNLIFIIISLSALLIAYNQLNKTRDATNIQSLNNFIERYNNKDMQEKRVALANNILNKEISFQNNILNFNKKFENPFNENKAEIAKTKNLIESVIYEFEVLGYFEEKNVYELVDIYELFSYEMSRYWLLVKFKSNFIDYIRKSDKEYYDRFENLFKKCIKYEIKSNNKEINFTNFKELIRTRIDELEIFLLEEKNLIPCSQITSN